MPMDQPKKKDLLLEMLSESMVMLHLDATHPEVEVPSYLKEDTQLRLNISYRFANVNLEVDDQYVYAALSFQQSPFRCKIPLESIWGATQHSTQDFRLFPDNIPPELREQLALYAALLGEVKREASLEESADSSSPSEGTTPERPSLRVVDESYLEDEMEEEVEEESVDTQSEEETPRPAPPKPDRSMFRVISNPAKK